MCSLRSSGIHIIFAYVCALILLCLPANSFAEDSVSLPDGSTLALPEKCPVCGMMIGGPSGPSVAVTYQDGHITGFQGVAAAVFKDGHVVGFEGARCLFIYNSLPQKFNIDINNITHQYVTDFVSKKLIDLSKAYLVLGSRVKGPMGYDLIAFTSKDAAADFARKYEGKWIVQLHEIPDVTQKHNGGASAGANKDISGDKKNTKTPKN